MTEASLHVPKECSRKADLHLYLCPMDLLGDSFNDADHNVLEAFPLGVVVKDQIVPLLCIGAAEGRSSHPRINSAQVVMKSIQILKVTFKMRKITAFSLKVHTQDNLAEVFHVKLAQKSAR